MTSSSTTDDVASSLLLTTTTDDEETTSTTVAVGGVEKVKVHEQRDSSCRSRAKLDSTIADGHPMRTFQNVRLHANDGDTKAVVASTSSYEEEKTKTMSIIMPPSSGTIMITKPPQAASSLLVTSSTTCTCTHEDHRIHEMTTSSNNRVVMEDKSSTTTTTHRQEQSTVTSIKSSITNDETIINKRSKENDDDVAVAVAHDNNEHHGVVIRNKKKENGLPPRELQQQRAAATFPSFHNNDKEQQLDASSSTSPSIQDNTNYYSTTTTKTKHNNGQDQSIIVSSPTSSSSSSSSLQLPSSTEDDENNPPSQSSRSSTCRTVPSHDDDDDDVVISAVSSVTTTNDNVGHNHTVAMSSSPEANDGVSILPYNNHNHERRHRRNNDDDDSTTTTTKMSSSSVLVEEQETKSNKSSKNKTSNDYENDEEEMVVIEQVAVASCEKKSSVELEQAASSFLFSDVVEDKEGTILSKDADDNKNAIVKTDTSSSTTTTIPDAPLLSIHEKDEQSTSSQQVATSMSAALPSQTTTTTNERSLPTNKVDDNVYNSNKSRRDHTTNRYKVNGIIRRPCVCTNSDQCRKMVAFWCQATTTTTTIMDDNDGNGSNYNHNFRDDKRAGYVRLPAYQPNAKTPTQLYKNSLRLSYLAHVRPTGSSPSARWMATTRPNGKNTAEYIALHHFPREFLKEGGKGLAIEYLEESMAKRYKLTKNDKINVASHSWHNKYFAPPCYKWSDLLNEYKQAANKVGTTIVDRLPKDDSDDDNNNVVLRESTRNPKPKILCLGMSKACVETQMDVEGYYWDVLEQRSPTVQQAKELAQRNILTQMDARDLARCRAMEARHRVVAYTVSQEHGAQYDRSRHMHANFNRANFCQALQKHFDKPTFRQIVLDYFWIPSGTWMTHHWSKSFFHTTLPNFVKHGLVEFPPPSEYVSSSSSSSPGTQNLGYGVVYLPFCLHCVKHLIASIDEIKQYYKISFLYKKELEEHALWSGTSTINAKDMQHFFGKNIAQEEIYCTFAPRDVFEAMEDVRITKAEVIQVLRGIEDFADVRMIRLTPLSKHNPRLKRTSHKIDDVGGFVGLLPPCEVQRGFDSLLPAAKVTETECSSSSSEEEEESSSEDEPEVEESRPSPVAKKKTTSRKNHGKSAVTSQAKAPALSKAGKKRKRLFGVLPDLDTYCTMGLDGNEDVMTKHELPLEMQFRRPCNIECYHLQPEPVVVPNEIQAVRVPSLVSKITLSFASGYDAEKIRTGLNAKPLMHAQEMLRTVACNSSSYAHAQGDVEESSMEQDTVRDEAKDKDASCSKDGDEQAPGVEQCGRGSSEQHHSPGYLMMLACASEMSDGVVRLSGR